MPMVYVSKRVLEGLKSMSSILGSGDLAEDVTGYTEDVIDSFEEPSRSELKQEVEDVATALEWIQKISYR